ncbi:MAG TPA: hypothetical protein VFN53_01580 [Acidobacteriaceae bacterium]|nr:hypothetical protein [Acidobacteriaceae bacterium]
MMQTPAVLRRLLPAFAMTCIALAASTLPAQMASPAQTKILAPEDLTRVMPATVFFRGQSASVQLRNSYGLRFSDGTMMLTALVDSSGYSSGIRQKYQGYILSEVPLTIGGKKLAAGAYGFGMLSDNTFVVMDLGAHDILRVPSQTDAALARPRPLAILPGNSPGSYRFYEGRRFVSIQGK